MVGRIQQLHKVLVIRQDGDAQLPASSATQQAVDELRVVAEHVSSHRDEVVRLDVESADDDGSHTAAPESGALALDGRLAELKRPWKAPPGLPRPGLVHQVLLSAP